MPKANEPRDKSLSKKGRCKTAEGRRDQQAPPPRPRPRDREQEEYEPERWDGMS